MEKEVRYNTYDEVYKKFLLLSNGEESLNINCVSKYSMKAESLNQYVGCTIKLILKNNFWYKGKVTHCEDKEFTFIDIKGNTVSVDPDFIMFIEEVKDEVL